MPSTSKLLLSALAVFGRRVEALPMSKHLSAFAPRKSVREENVTNPEILCEKVSSE